jgi:hypothetical protein
MHGHLVHRPADHRRRTRSATDAGLGAAGRAIPVYRLQSVKKYRYVELVGPSPFTSNAEAPRGDARLS